MAAARWSGKWPEALAAVVVGAHAVVATAEMELHESWVLLLYLLALVPPFTGFLRAAPGSRDRLGASGLIVVQAILGVGPMYLLDPMEQGFARAVGDLLSTAAVVGIGFLVAITTMATTLLRRRNRRPQT